MSRIILQAPLLLAATAGALLAFAAPASARETRACVRNSLTLNLPVNVQIARTTLDPATNEARPQPTAPQPLASGAERCETFTGSSRAPIVVEVSAIGGGSRLICRSELAPFSFLLTVSGNSIVGAACSSADLPGRAHPR